MSINIANISSSLENKIVGPRMKFIHSINFQCNPDSGLGRDSRNQNERNRMASRQSLSDSCEHHGTRCSCEQHVPCESESSAHEPDASGCTNIKHLSSHCALRQALLDLLWFIFYKTYSTAYRITVDTVNLTVTILKFLTIFTQ